MATSTVACCLLQIELASVVSPAFAVETLTVTCMLAIELSSIVSLPFAVNCHFLASIELASVVSTPLQLTPVVVYSLDADASCGETLLLPLLFVILHTLSLSLLQRTLSICSKYHIYSVPFFELLSMHQED